MNRQRLHELTPEGIEAAKAWLAALRGGLSIPFPDTILTSSLYAQTVESEIYVEQRNFKTRRDVGIYFIRTLAPLASTRTVNNPYLWSWLGMFYFNQIARKDADGKPNLGRSPDIAYVIDPSASQDFRRETRWFANRLMLAYDIYWQHSENAWFMLDEPVNSLSRFTMRLASAPELFRSRGIVSLAHLLYADPKTRQIKANSGSTSRATAPPGSLPRLIDVLTQLYMTYEVYGMTAEQLMSLLPPEFDRFKPMT